MENRDKNLLALRPKLDLAEADSKIETFQNKTLRPVLKFQNELILEVCRHQFVKRKSIFFKLSEKEQLDYIEQQISRDNNFKNLLTGIVISLFSLEEWHFFKEQEQEVKKRIASLLIQRLQSQLSFLQVSPD